MKPLDLRGRFERTFGGLPSQYWTLWLGVLINRMGGFVVPFLGLYLTRERGLGVEDAGAIVALYGAGSVTAALAGGVLADHLGRRKTLLLALAGGATVMLLLGVARAPLLIALLTFLLSLASDLQRPATAALIADVVPPKDRLRAYGLLHWAVNIGFSVAPVLAGVLADVGYTVLFVADAATTLVYLAIAAARVREPAHDGTPREPMWRGLRLVSRDHLFTGFVALTFVLAVVYKQVEVALAVDIGAHGISPRGYGAIIAVNGALIVLLSPTVARLIAGMRRERLLAVAALCTGFGFALHAPASTGIGFAIGVAVWTLGEIMSAPGNSAIVADRAPPALRGRYQGMFQMAWGLAAFVGPTVGTRVVGAWGADALWLACGVVGIAVAAGFMIVARRL
jgi:MFS family permease